MTAHTPVLPLAGATLTRAAIGLLTQATQLANRLARVARNRREARLLAGLDRHMLADIGLTHADVSDAFSSPIWEDPTCLLHERVNERRLNRPVALKVVSAAEPAFHRPPTSRPARQSV